MKANIVDPRDKSMSWADHAEPRMADDEVLLRVKAAGVNRADLMQRDGKYPPPADSSEILGLEASGLIEKIGCDVSGFAVGERVFSLLSGGGYAEYVNVPAAHLMPIPDNLDFQQAASIPEAYFTAYLNLVLEGKLCRGETVLIHAAASGVGTAAVQIAVSMGAKVLATAGSDEKCSFVKSNGAHHCINYKKADFAAEYGDNSVDLVLDMAGQRHLSSNLRVLRYRGRLIMLSLISGSRSEIDLLPVIRKNLLIKGSTLRDRSRQEKALITSEFSREILPLFLSGSLKPAVWKVFPVEQAFMAHQELATDSNRGKVVLKVSD